MENINKNKFQNVSLEKLNVSLLTKYKQKIINKFESFDDVKASLKENDDYYLLDCVDNSFAYNLIVFKVNSRKTILSLGCNRKDVNKTDADENVGLVMNKSFNRKNYNFMIDFINKPNKV